MKISSHLCGIKHHCKGYSNAIIYISGKASLLGQLTVNFPDLLTGHQCSFPLNVMDFSHNALLVQSPINIYICLHCDASANIQHFLKRRCKNSEKVFHFTIMHFCSQILPRCELKGVALRLMHATTLYSCKNIIILWNCFGPN